MLSLELSQARFPFARMTIATLCLVACGAPNSPGPCGAGACYVGGTTTVTTGTIATTTTITTGTGGGPPPPDSYDIVVYGGTSAGVVAAVQAAAMGKTAVVIEPTQHIGGISAAGLGATDSGDRSIIGGLSRAFYRRLKAHYDESASWTQQSQASYPYYSPTDDAIWRFEPHVAEAAFHAMLAEAKVPLVLGERLDLEGGVEKQGAAITRITMETGRAFRAGVYIDATYEGDLMARAGVTYTVGREANAQYGETLNGVQTGLASGHQFIYPIDPYVMPGDPASGLLPGIQDAKPGPDGSADDRVQAYNFRLCLTRDPGNKVPFPAPAGYDPQRYELLLRYVQAGWRGVFGNNQEMPNLKTDMNNHGAVSTDGIGMNSRYPDGDYATRAGIIADHEAYQKGLLYFLANDPRVPADLQAEVSSWGLAKDEFTDNGGWPHQLYVREARRMVSDYVHTELDCRKSRVTPDPVGMGSYNMDSHNVQRYVGAGGVVRNEGNIEVSPGGSYMVSYRSIRPRADECTNLLVPVALSASHIAFGSIRMEPVFMVLGQSAGTAAALAIDGSTGVQSVEYAALRARLLADGQVLDPGSLDPGALPGLVIDDSEASLVGAWTVSNTVASYVGSGYRHDGNADKGAKSATFTVDLPAAGKYEVRFGYTPFANRATNVPVTLHPASGPVTLFVNEQVAPPLSSAFVSLGAFDFPAGPTSVVVATTGTNGFVVIDAVAFVVAP